MKELSIEEKAKAYDEAIEKAKIWQEHLYDVNDKDYADELNYIFPELKESENERIRKEITEFLKKASGGFLDTTTQCKTFGKWLSWLEKQGEHSKFYDSIQVGDKVTRNEDGVLVNLSQLKRVAKVDERQGENFPILSNSSNIGKGEQKPAWSEEDEKYTQGLIRGLKANRDIFKFTIFISDSDSLNITSTIDWLESLKNRVQPQEKQEWSKEDIDMIDWLIRCCEKEHEELCNDKYGHQDIVSDLKRDCRKKWDWIESLKNKVVPQNRWKPSDEQMEALKEACDEHWEPDGLDPLYTLYQDLKKLKG